MYSTETLASAVKPANDTAVLADYAPVLIATDASHGIVNDGTWYVVKYVCADFGQTG